MSPIYPTYSNHVTPCTDRSWHQVARVAEVAPRRLGTDAHDAIAHALAPWKVLQRLTPAPHVVLGRAEADLNGVVLGIVRLQPFNASTGAEH